MPSCERGRGDGGPGGLLGRGYGGPRRGAARSSAASGPGLGENFSRFGPETWRELRPLRARDLERPPAASGP